VGGARRLGAGVRARTAAGAPALDLRAGTGAALAAAGVVDRTDVDVCTYESVDHFSHRRDGVTGRQALIVTRRP
jgi:copper oxidase (laccase) domain-containing protein